MKKFIVFIMCAVLLIGTVRVISLRYQDSPEDFEQIGEWIEVGKETVGEVTDSFSKKISEQNWGLEGSYDIDSENWFDDEGVTYSGSMEYTRLCSGEIGSFSIQAAGCRVEVVVTEEPDFYFAFENMKKVQAYEKGNHVSLKTVRDTLINEEDEKNILTLYVPETCFLETVELELGAGSMQIENLCAENVHISVEAGKLTVDAMESKDMTVSLGAGAVSLNKVNIQNAELSVGAGTMSLNGRIHGDIEADCAMGNLQMELDDNVKSFNYELQCMAGNILLNGEKHSGINEGMLIDHAASKDMKLNCAIGNMKIEFEE